MIHVNKLKEGWDVTNLFTIVPLRASASDILTEQTLGRGLRLPYGKRTGVEAVDTLTVIAHDRFNDLIEKAKDADGVIHSLKQVRIGEGGDVPTDEPANDRGPLRHRADAQSCSRPRRLPRRDAPASERPRPRFTFQKDEELALAQTVLTRRASRGSDAASPPLRDLNVEKVIKRIVADALAIQSEQSRACSPTMTQDQAEAVVTEFCAALVARTIAIPELTVTPRDQVSFGFQPFTLESLAGTTSRSVASSWFRSCAPRNRQVSAGDDGGERAGPTGRLSGQA